MAFLEDVWSRNFLNLFGSPLSIGEYSAPRSLSIATSSVGLLMMVVLASAVFGLSFFGYGLLLVPFLLVSSCSGSPRIFGSALVLRFGPASEWLVWPVPALLSPFAAVFYPVSTLPTGCSRSRRLLPSDNVFEGIRANLAGRGICGNLAGVEFWCLSAFYILLASWFYSRIHRQAVRHRTPRALQRGGVT